MKVATVLAALGGSVVLLGCSPSAAAAHEDDLSASLELCETEVKELLRDPDSAQFTYVHIFDKKNVASDAPTWTVKGKVRAKNAFGGYADEVYWECAVTRPEGSHDLSASAQFVDLNKVLEDARRLGQK